MNFLMLLSFFVYMIALIVVGIAKKSDNTPYGFYLGNKKADKYVSGISAQTSTFGAYVFMTLPGLIYAFGANKAWVAAGLFLGTIITWGIIPERLRKYSNINKQMVTVPEYLNYRFECKNQILKYFSAFMILIVLTTMSICSFILVGRVLAYITDLNYGSALVICLIVLSLYVALGGYYAVCLTDYIQGLLMMIGIFAISIVPIMLMGKEYIVPNIYHSGLNSSVMNFLNVFEKNGSRISVVEIFSQICVGLGICGLPQVTIRFMGIKDGKTLVKSRRIAIIWGLGILVSSCIAGVIGRAYLYPVVLKNDGKEYEFVYMEMIKKAFEHDINTPFVTGILLCSALAAIMAALDSQIFSAASAMANDILCGKLFNKISDHNKVLIGRICVIGIAIFSCAVAFFVKIDVDELLKGCWSLLGCSFGPTIILSLYWKRMNGKGAMAGMMAGVISFVLWKYLSIIEISGDSITLEKYFKFDSIAIGFMINFMVTIFVSLITKPISDEKEKEFYEIMNYTAE